MPSPAFVRHIYLQDHLESNIQYQRRSVMMISKTKNSRQSEGEKSSQKWGGATNLTKSTIRWITPRWRGSSTKTLRWEVYSNRRAARARYSSWITHNTSKKESAVPRLREKMKSQIALSPHLKDTALFHLSILWINSGKHKVASFPRHDALTFPWNPQYASQISK